MTGRPSVPLPRFRSGNPRSSRVWPLVAAGAVLAYAPLLVLALLSIQIGTSSIRAQVENRLTSSAALSAQFVGGHMQGVVDVASALAKSPDLQTALVDRLQSPQSAALIHTQLALLHSSVPGVLSTSLIDASGTLLDSYPPLPASIGLNFSRRDWYRGVTSTQAPYVSEAFVGATSDKPLVVSTAVPVFAASAGHSLLAIITVAYPLRSIQAFTDQFGSANQLTLTVVDQHGHLVAGPGIGGGTLRSLAADSRVKLALAGKSGVDELTLGGRRVLSAYAPIAGLNWVLLSQVDTSVALADAARLTTSVLALTGLISLVIAGGIVLVGINLARRRDVETRLREQSLQSVQLLEGLPVGIFMLGEDGRPQYANRLSTEMLGQGIKPDADSKDLAEVYRVYEVGTNDLFPSEQLPIVRALAGEHVIGDVEIARGDGRIALEVWASPIRNQEGRLTAAVAAFLDVTERRQTQRDLAKLNVELEDRVRQRTADLEAFTYTVSHDLRTPIRAIVGFADVLVEDSPDQLDASALDAVGEIRSSAVRLGQLVDDLLAFSRLGKKEIKRQTIDMTALAMQVTKLVAQVWPSPMIRIDVKQMPACVGDPALVELVYMNLLTNAIKFTAGRPDAPIEVGAEIEDGSTVYYVRDHGVGFDMAHAGQLFGVFQRLHSLAEFEGNGVGLASVRRIVTAHGGRVWAQATLNEGATFFFTLGCGNDA
jgi:PAS domain S-box-containing protein